MSEVVASLIPDTAPFSAPQRAWLNGFFAGLFGKDEPATPEAPTEDMPWHDPSLGLADRMALAVDRPPARQIMAAMAQLDCGQCGYLCQSYAEAIASGAEAALGKCVPGGRETARQLKDLVARLGVVASSAGAPARPADRVAPVTLARRLRLTHVRSDKDTRHIEFDLTDSGLAYEVGDSLGVQPENCPVLVGAVIDALGATGDEPVRVADGRDMVLAEALCRACDIGRPSDGVLNLLGVGEDPGDADLLDLLQAASQRPSPAALAAALGALQPRLYSIASSSKTHPGEVHLTVGVVRTEKRGRLRQGVASTFLAERLKRGRTLSAFVKKAHAFSLPADPSRSIVMVGPGTGIAPFRAFLQERQAVGAKGKNWLFFGAPHRDTDFLYRDEIEAYTKDGHLARLDLAFSRDQAAKIYVQDRMRERARELWSWLEDGAHFFVCGDAKRMAKDVDEALRAIVAAEGRMTPDAARAHVARLAADGRYQRDVY